MACGPMSVTDAPIDESPHWTPSWGQYVRKGDLMRVTKLGGPVKVVGWEKFTTGTLDTSYVLGLIVEDLVGDQYHLMVQPHEAVWISVDTGTEGDRSEGESAGA